MDLWYTSLGCHYSGYLNYSVPEEEPSFHLAGTILKAKVYTPVASFEPQRGPIATVTVAVMLRQSPLIVALGSGGGLSGCLIDTARVSECRAREEDDTQASRPWLRIFLPLRSRSCLKFEPWGSENR